MNNRNLSLEEKVKSLTAKSDLVREIKTRCNLAEIKQIVSVYIPLMKTFSDTINETLVEEYKKKVHVGDCIELATFLGSAVTKKKINDLDLMTYTTESVTHVAIGAGKVSISDGTKTQTVETSGGVMGGIDGPQALAQLISVCGKIQAEGKDAKARTFAKGNLLAPNEAVSAAMARISMMGTLNVSELHKQAESIKDLSTESYERIAMIVNANSAKTIVDDTDVPILTLTTEDEDEGEQRGVATYPLLPTRYVFSGEYPIAANQMNTYLQGSTFPAVKRLGRKSWTGTPIDNLPCDHIIALHDAGVPVDSSILVVSSDTNIISLVRSNFGAKVYGIGIGDPCFIAPSEVGACTFDYVYYPESIKFSPTGSFEVSCKNFREAFLKKTQHFAAGKALVHVSPLAFYCKEFCEVFGLKPASQSPAVAKPSIAAAKFSTKGVNFGPTATTNYGMPDSPVDPERTDDIKIATYFAANPSLFHKMRAVKTYTQLSWGNIAHLDVPASVTQLSYKGTILVGAKEIIPMPRVIGDVLAVIRDTFKSIWCVGYSSYNTYNIRLLCPGAVVANLVYDDLYSAMYKSKLTETFEKRNFQLIAQAGGNSSGANVAPPPPSEEKKGPPAPKKIVKKKPESFDFRLDASD